MTDIPRAGITIVVPVYNAYEHVERCLASLERTVRPGQAEIVLVNDASPDPRIVDLLTKFDEESSLTTTIISRQHNGGFIQACNDGITFAKGRDVVLLNSDTEGVGRWLELLENAAHEERFCGIVFPVSNSASIFSCPVLQDAVNVAGPTSVGGALYELMSERNLIVPTAVGFCMYVRADVVSAVGLLDTAFGKGYGEENDFCMKARKIGYTIAFVPSALVLHFGGASMVAAGIRGEHDTSVTANEQLLMKRHPTYEREVTDPDFRRELQVYLDRVTAIAIRCLLEHQPSVVHLTHVPPSEKSTGGIERHINDLLTAQAESGLSLLLAPSDGTFKLTAATKSWTITLETGIHDQGFGVDRPSLANDQMVALLTSLEPKYVHIHNLIGSSTALVSALRREELRTVFTVHDYYLASPDFTLLHPDLPTNAMGRRHVDHYFGTTDFDPADWRSRGAALAQTLDIIIAPSRASAKTLAAALSIELPMHVLAHPEARTTIPTPAVATRSVVFLGAVHKREKGSVFITELVPELLRAGVHCHFLGSRVDDWPHASWKRSKGVTFHGRFSPSEVQARLRNIGPKIGVLASPWPETWSYTLSELWLCGIPAAVNDLGAPQERVRETGAGIVLPASARQAAHDIVAAIDDETTYARIKSAAIAAMNLAPSIPAYLASIDHKLGDRQRDDERHPTRPVALGDLLALFTLTRVSLRPPSLVDRLQTWLIPKVPSFAIPTLVAGRRRVASLLSR